MTKALERYLAKLQRFYHEVGILPSYREFLVMNRLKSLNSAFKIYHTFVKEGYLKRVGGRFAPEDKFFL